LKQFNKAIPELEKELALNPSHPSANYVLGHIYLHSDPQQLERAEFYLQRAIAAKPDYAAAREQLGRTLSLRHEYQKAVQELELAASEDPRNESVHYLLAATYRKMGLEDKAQKELDTFNQLHAERHMDDKPPQ
jgi:tetratricopeptide (TPR) repeat protein